MDMKAFVTISDLIVNEYLQIRCVGCKRIVMVHTIHGNVNCIVPCDVVKGKCICRECKAK